jgi:hypothetical protein
MRRMNENQRMVIKFLGAGAVLWGVAMGVGFSAKVQLALQSFSLLFFTTLTLILCFILRNRPLSSADETALLKHLAEGGVFEERALRVVRGINWFLKYDLDWIPGVREVGFDMGTEKHCVLARATKTLFIKACDKYRLRIEIEEDLGFWRAQEEKWSDLTLAWDFAASFFIYHP